MKKILCIGQSTYDTTYVVNSYPKENKKIKADNVYSMGGGSAGNSAYLLAKFKEPTTLVSTIQADYKGEFILNEYKSVGLDISHCVISDTYSTPANAILINATNGSRTIVGYKTKNIIPDSYCVICGTKPEIIYSDGYEIDIVKKAIEKFPDVPLVLDAGANRPEFIELAPFTTYFICSEDFALDFCGLDTIEEDNFNHVFNKIEEINKNNIIVTIGKRGSLYKENGQIKQIPAFKVKAIDTTAAGDIFHGAFVYGISNNFSIEKCILFASACSAISVTRIGGQTSIPQLEEVYNFLKLNAPQVQW